MIELTPVESRVLASLVEKAHTTPAQYPLSLNALTVACNQKSNRHPVVDYDEERVLDALERLRAKGLAVVVSLSGSRVLKYKHNAREGLGVGTAELVLLTELLLRGPQTVGELRGHVCRMHALESVDQVRTTLVAMCEGDRPLVRRLAPEPGGRAERFAQLLCPQLHPADMAAAPASAAPAAAEPDAGLEQRVDRLEQQLEHLRRAVERLGQALGQSDLLA